MTNLEIPQEYKDAERGEVNMCQAWQEMIEDGRKEGEEIGKQIGEQLGEERYGKLILKLTEEGREDMILKSASDTELRSRLFVEYHI